MKWQKSEIDQLCTNDLQYKYIQKRHWFVCFALVVIVIAFQYCLFVCLLLLLLFIAAAACLASLCRIQFGVKVSLTNNTTQHKNSTFSWVFFSSKIVNNKLTISCYNVLSVDFLFASFLFPLFRSVFSLCVCVWFCIHLFVVLSSCF